VLTILLGLGSAFCYALVDLLMVKVVRAVPVATAMVWLVGVGVLVSVPLALAVDGVPRGDAEWRGLGIAALGGLTYMAALGALFRGLAVGQLSIVSPLNALEGAFAALVAIVLGERLGGLAAVGLPLAVAGAVLASLVRTPVAAPAVVAPVTTAQAAVVPVGGEPTLSALGTTGSPVESSDGGGGGPGVWAAARGAGWALLAAVAGGTTILIYGWAADLPPLSAVAISRLVSFAIMLSYAATHDGVKLPRRWRRRVLFIGVVDAAAFVALAFATARGPMSIAAVTTAQFATFGVILGAFVLRERPAAQQRAGIVATLAAVTLLALAEGY
jgi:drug/metabolite transporter (DMT)-like permease